MSKTVRILHTSDWQIGMKRWFLRDRAPLFAEARAVAIEKLADCARECDAVVVAGDVFDTPTLPTALHHRFLEAMGHFTTPVYLLPGNHDYYHPGSLWDSDMGHKLEDMGVTILRDESIHHLPGLQICGAPLQSNIFTADPMQSLIDNLPDYDDDTVRVLVGHGRCGASFGADSAGHISLDRLTGALDDNLCDYVALGDTHSREQLDAEGRVFYSGAPEVTAFDDKERASGQALIVELAPRSHGRTINVEPVNVGTWSFHAEHAEISGHDDLAAWLDRIEQWDDKSRTVIKYSLQGSINSRDSVMLEDRINGIEQAFANLYQRERLMDLAIVPEDFDLADWGLRGYALKAAEDLMACDDQASRDALALLYRLTEEK